MFYEFLAYNHKLLFPVWSRQTSQNLYFKEKLVEKEKKLKNRLC